MAPNETRRLARLEPLLLIAVGGFLGAVLRWSLAIQVPPGFPLGTLVANVLGAFLLGVLLYEAHCRDLLSPGTRLLVGTGFCSSLTTYSTFAAETIELDPALATANVAGTYALGFAAVLLGQAVARWLS
jgi:CrcB protein